MNTIYQAIVDLENSGEPGTLCTIIDSTGSTPRHEGSKMLVYADGHFTGTVGGGEIERRVIDEAILAIGDGKSKVLKYNMIDPGQGDPGVCGGTVEVFLEPLIPQPKIVVIGGGHVGKAVAHLAKWLGFRVAITDDREEFSSPESFPDADEYYQVQMADLPKYLTINSKTYLVLTTRGMNLDISGLPALIETDAAYLGVIGSKRRWAMTRKSLLEAGVAEEKIDEIYSPIGLELNAETPEEIAVSIMAEIIMLRNKGTGNSMKVDSKNRPADHVA